MTDLDKTSLPTGAGEIKNVTPVLEMRDVEISYFARKGQLTVVPGVDLRLYRGQALGLVGESGCGKSTIAYAVMNYLGGNGRITGGQVLFEGEDIATMPAAALRQLRGHRMAMVYQDPMSSLNPTMKIGPQLMEVPMLHAASSREEARARALAMLEEVQMPDPAGTFERYPHQLSGGQQQRVVIAMALMSEPALLVMDEPTTGLDVTVEAAVLDLVAALQRRHRTALLFISHNLGTVARVCDRVGIMYLGDIVEHGPVEHVFAEPRHPYTIGLLGSLPVLGADKHQATLQPIPGSVGPIAGRPFGCVYQDRCPFKQSGVCDQRRVPSTIVAGTTGTGLQTVRCERLDVVPRYRRPRPGLGEAVRLDTTQPVIEAVRLGKTYVQAAGLFGGGERREVRALNEVSLTAGRGRTLAIVGESGSGKSTFAKILTGLEKATDGRLEVLGVDLGQLPIERRGREVKRHLQMVFQNPDSTLNPSHSVGFAIRRSLRRLRGLSGAEAREEMLRLLRIVQLPEEFAARMPRQLSGGQKQRVAIARALAGHPEILVADEPVSALDVSVQAAIIQLLIQVQADLGQTMVFISHDLAVVRFLADEVAVMYAGHLVELGPVAAVYRPPYHPYTEALLSAVPIADPAARQKRIQLSGGQPKGSARGCVFAGRCPRKLGRICEDEPPPMMTTPDGKRILCHIPLAELERVDPVVTIADAAE